MMMKVNHIKINPNSIESKAAAARREKHKPFYSSTFDEMHNNTQWWLGKN